MNSEMDTVLCSFLPASLVSSWVIPDALNDMDPTVFKYRNKGLKAAIALLIWIRCYEYQ